MRLTTCGSKRAGVSKERQTQSAPRYTPLTSHSTIMPTHNDHDDFGGLHRDLIATGAAMDRRQLLRVAARFGATIGALQLFGCGSATAAETLTGGTTGAAGACR